MVLRSLALLGLVLLIGCSGTTTEQSSSYTEQEQLVTTSYSYIQQLDWANYATLMHPNSLAEFRMMLMPGIEKLVMASSSDSIAIFNKSYSSEHIQNMPVDSFFVEMMSMMETLSPQFAAAYGSLSANVLGSIPEGDSLLHVVVRASMNTPVGTRDELEVQSLSKDGDSWKLSSTIKISGIAEYIRMGLPQ